ncbi:Rpn family recombination-promoting nuclease/putative transposase [Methanobrevibacter sp. TMH8]|nr:Rpn family recombination-promoting nuclease/putative transposase [Methanobrevibacter sp. TMH8]
MFGERGCEKETLHLINTFTKRNCTDLSFETNEMKGQHEGNKKSVTDVLVMTNDGNIVNIESQIKKQEKFHKRTHFYDSSLNSVFLSAGENYNELPLVITINILGFNLHPLEKYHTTFKLTETTYKEYILDDVIETHNIDLVKFRKSKIF